jgi:hypothetical protein
MADLLARRKASTTATSHKVLKILYGWLAEEEENPTNPILSADWSPASVNILVPREDLNLQPLDSHTRRSVPELQGQGWCWWRRRGRTRAVDAPSVAPCQLRYVPVGLVWCRDQESNLHSRWPRSYRLLPRRWGLSAGGGAWSTALGSSRLESLNCWPNATAREPLHPPCR